MDPIAIGTFGPRPGIQSAYRRSQVAVVKFELSDDLHKENGYRTRYNEHDELPKQFDMLCAQRARRDLRSARGLRMQRIARALPEPRRQDDGAPQNGSALPRLHARGPYQRRRVTTRRARVESADRSSGAGAPRRVRRGVRRIAPVQAPRRLRLRERPRELPRTRWARDSGFGARPELRDLSRAARGRTAPGDGFTRRHVTASGTYGSTGGHLTGGGGGGGGPQWQ